MVAPLDVHVVEIHQLVHDDVGPGAAVEDVADDVEAVDGQILDQFTEGDDKFVRHPDFDDGVENLAVVHILVAVPVIHVEQLVDDVGKFHRHLFADLGAGVFGGDHPADLHQAVDGDPLPVVGQHPGGPAPLQTPLRVVDQVGQLHLLLLGDDVSEGVPDLLPDDPRRAPQQVDEGLILPVQIAEEIFRPLGQPLNSRQVDDFAAGCLYAGVFPGQQFQIIQISHEQFLPFSASCCICPFFVLLSS